MPDANGTKVKLSMVVNWALTIGAILFAAGGMYQSSNAARQEIDGLKAKAIEQDRRINGIDVALAGIQADLKTLIRMHEVTQKSAP